MKNHAKIQTNNQTQGMPKISQNKSKKKIHNVRAQLRSLHHLQAYNPSTSTTSRLKNKGINNLEKLLAKQNVQLQDPEVSSDNVPRDIGDEIILEDRLWHYFENKIQVFSQRIEKDKINQLKKLLTTIIREVSKKIESNENHMFQMETLIKNKYKQTHCLFKEIQTIKNQRIDIQIKSATRKRQGNQSEPEETVEKIGILYQNINSLNDQIQQQESDKIAFQREISKLKSQRKSLLINFMKNGYYLEDGLLWIFINLHKIGYKINTSDLPKFLDGKSKFYLIKQFNQVVQRQNSQDSMIKRNKTMSVKSNFLATGNLTQKQKLKDIYGETKNYLQVLIREGTMKKTELKLPKIITTRDTKIQTQIYHRQCQQVVEKRRIQTVYPDQLRIKAKKIIFGTKLDTILND